MESNSLLQVHVGQGVSRDNKKPLRQLSPGEFDRACCSQGLVLYIVLYPYAPLGPVAEVLLDDLRHELKGSEDILETVTLEKVYDVLHTWCVNYGDHGFGLFARQRPEPRPLTPSHDHRLHVPQASAAAAASCYVQVTILRRTRPGREVKATPHRIFSATAFCLVGCQSRRRRRRSGATAGPAQRWSAAPRRAWRRRPVGRSGPPTTLASQPCGARSPQ